MSTMEISPNDTWNDLCRILNNYLLTTSVPLMFRPFLEFDSLKKLYNVSYRNFNEMRKEKKKTPDAKDNPVNKDLKKNKNKDKDESKTTPNDVWEHLLRNALTDAFKHRLLGTQSDMKSYRQRSEKYLRVWQDILGAGDTDNKLDGITESYFDMLKDYLCRNMPFLPENITERPVTEVMKACQQVYKERRFCHNLEGDVEKWFYINFEEQSYTTSLLSLTYEIAQNMQGHPKARHFLMVSSYIHTLFIYVYMVEFVKNFPYAKGKWVNKDAALELGMNYNLFKFLAKADFIGTFEMLEQEARHRLGLNGGNLFK